MADWAHGMAFGGETNDIAMDAPSIVRTTACTISSHAPVTGSYDLTFPLNTSGANCTVPLVNPMSTGSGGTDSLFASCYLKLSAAPSSEIGLICTYASPTTERFVRIGTDQKIYIYDSGGTQRGGVSRSTISTSAMTHFAIMYDFNIGSTGGTAGSNNKAYVCLWVNGEWQWDGLVVAPVGTLLMGGASATFDTLVWGEDLDAGVTRGCTMYMDDADADKMNYATYDSKYIPHVTQRPVIQVVGASTLPPTINASQVAWTLGTGDYTGVDEYPNDGATTVTGNLTNSAKETYRYSAANPTDSADTIHNVQRPAVKRETSGAKTSCLALLRDTAGNETTVGWAGSGTSFLGDRRGIGRPGGGSWVYTDFDHFSGTSTGVTATTMTDTGATGWGTDTLIGAVVTSGGVTATITSNTATVLTFTGGWSGATPSTGAYTIAASKLEFGMQGPSANAGTDITSLPGPEIVKYEALMAFGRMFN